MVGPDEASYQFCPHECSTSCRELPQDDFDEDGAGQPNGTMWDLGGTDAFMFVFCVQSLWKTGDRLAHRVGSWRR